MNYTPFRKTAKIALMAWGTAESNYVGFTEEAAEEAIKTWSYDKLQEAVGAEGSMTAGAIALADELGLSAEEKSKLIDLVLGKNKVELTQEDQEFYNKLGQKFSALPNKGKTVVKILSAIHDDWVQTPSNASKFNNPKREGKRYQHLPLEMIGLDEAKTDDDFFKTVLDSMGVEVSEQEKAAAYTEMSTEFYDKNGFLNENGIDEEAVVKKVMKGKEFYPALTENVNEAKDKNVAKAVVAQSMSKMASVKMRG